MIAAIFSCISHICNILYNTLQLLSGKHTRAHTRTRRLTRCVHIFVDRHRAFDTLTAVALHHWIQFILIRWACMNVDKWIIIAQKSTISFAVPLCWLLAKNYAQFKCAVRIHRAGGVRERKIKINKSFNIVPYAQQQNPNWSANLICNLCSKTNDVSKFRSPHHTHVLISSQFFLYTSLD